MFPRMNMLFIGEPLWEYTGTRLNKEEAALKGEKEGAIVDRKETGAWSGDMLNMAVYTQMAAKKLGVDAHIDILSAVGTDDDPRSRRVLRDFEQHGFGIQHIERIPDKTLGSVCELHNTDGTQADEKSRMDRANSAAREMLKDATDEQLKELAGKYTYIVVSGIPLACVKEREKLVKLVTYAREKVPPAKIVFSTNLRHTNWFMQDHDHPDGIDKDDPQWQMKAREWHDKMIKLADYVFANTADEAKLRGEEDPKKIAANLGALNAQAEIVLTNDKDPITLRYAREGGTVTFTVPIYPAKEVLGTVGGGDALAATYMIMRKAGKPPLEAVKRGTFVASQVMEYKSALPPADHPPLLFYGPRYREQSDSAQEMTR